MADMTINQLLREYAELGSEPAFAALVEHHLGLVHGTALRQVHDPHLAEDVAQDQSLRQVGEQLGLSEEAAKKRVARAIDRLRSFFAARGFTLTPAALGSVLGQQLAQSAPAGLAPAITAKSLTGVGAVETALPVLVQETLRAWAWAKAKLTGAIGLGAVAAVMVTTTLWLNRGMESLAESESSVAPIVLANEGTSFAALTGDSNALATVADQPEERVLWLQVLARDTGEPVPNARLAVNEVIPGEWRQRHDLATDEHGYAEVPYDAGIGRLDIGVVSPGWAARSVRWNPFHDDPIPASYQLLVNRVTEAMGGWVLDTRGGPIEGAVVWAHLGMEGDHSDRETPRESFGFVWPVPVAQTDPQGFWSVSLVPRGDSTRFQLQVKHPDYAEATLHNSNTDSETLTALEDLWAGEWIATLDPALALVGRVLDLSGQPVSGAQLVHAPHSPEAVEVQTDATGAFVIPARPSGSRGNRFEFVVTADGFAPEHREIEVRSELEPVEVRLRPGATLRVRLVDAAGGPVPEARLSLEQWGRHRHNLKWSALSGADGLIEWHSAPPGVDLDLVAVKEGWCYTRWIKLVADGQEHVVSMRRALELVGRVTDSLTGLPVTELRAFPGYGRSLGGAHWERSATRRSEDGAYRVVFSEDQFPWSFRIEAPGYAPFMSEPISPDHQGWLDVSLQPTGHGDAVHGIVLRPDGSPAAHASVALLASERRVRLHGTRFTVPGQDHSISITHTDGRFDFAADPQAHTVVAVTDDGFARQAVRRDGQPITLELQPWGRVDVTVDAGFKDHCRRASLVDAASESLRNGLEIAHLTNQIPYWREGQFRFLQVPPGAYLLQLSAGVDGAPHYQTPVTVEPDVSATLHIEPVGPELL
jgi:hypothetical protein